MIRTGREVSRIEGVLFFVYPLKFVFANVVAMVLGQRTAFLGMGEANTRLVMLVFSAGFVAVFAIFALLYWNVYRRRVQLELGALDAFDAQAGARTHLISVAVGLASIGLALVLPIYLIGAAGMIYGLQGPLHWRNGVLIARARATVLPASTPAPQ
jgi:hypothetical protein